MAPKRKKQSDPQPDKSSADPKPTTHAAAPVSDEEAERMFLYWRSAAGQRSVLEVSRKFARHRTTVHRAYRRGFLQPDGKRESWEERDLRIQQEVRNKLDKKQVKQEVSNIEYIRTLKKVAYQGLFKKDDKGRTVLRQTPKISEVARLIELDQEMSAGLPPGETAGGSGGISEDSLRQAIVYLDLLKQLSPDIIKAIGDYAAGKDLPCFEYEQTSEDKDGTE